ncbi:hypothetical protein J1614_009350 [Plenodomus biglobosus]|nr:hypothetical protein J1614_009350 [Plenodomus biglobosus]
MATLRAVTQRQLIQRWQPKLLNRTYTPTLNTPTHCKNNHNPPPQCPPRSPPPSPAPPAAPPPAPQHPSRNSLPQTLPAPSAARAACPPTHPTCSGRAANPRLSSISTETAGTTV